MHARARAEAEGILLGSRIVPPEAEGTQGSGTEFERITWDEALDTIAAELKRVQKNHGPEAILFVNSGGDKVVIHTAEAMSRLLAMAGGFTDKFGVALYQGAMFAASVTYGTVYATNTRDDLLNSRLSILWGWDPATTVTGTNTPWFLMRAKEGGTRIITIDPYFSDSAADSQVYRNLGKPQ